MINQISSWCCISEESSKICITSASSIICLLTSVAISASSISEYSKILQEDQENTYLINTLVCLGITGIISGIFSMSNFLQIILQLSTASICIKIQKYYQTGVIFIYLIGIILEYVTIEPGQNSERIYAKLINIDIVLGILMGFTILAHIFC